MSSGEQNVEGLWGPDGPLQSHGEDAFAVRPLVAPSIMKGSMAERFEEFHRQNPHVYQAIVRIAHDLKGRGFSKCSIWLIFNRLRWLYAIQTQGDEFRLNNNFTAYYARTVMAANADLDGFFEVRKHKGQEPYLPDLAALGLERGDG